MNVPLERLDIMEMASGDSSLLLSERVPWESFPTYAEAVVQLVGGSVVDRADSPVERVWTIDVGGRLFWLAYDELGVSLDSKSEQANALIPSFRQTLMNYRARTAG
jgi:hypothetical protein